MAYKYKLVQEIKNLDSVLNNIIPTDLDTDLEQDEENRALGNTPMNDEERNMTPEEYKKYREKEREEQGKKNLAKEVLNKLKNR